MSMTIWNEVSDLERRVDDLFRGLSWPRSFWLAPAVADVFQRDGDLVVRAELPGIDPEKDVKVTLTEGEVVISGERRQKTEVKKEDCYRMESSYGSFERHVPVPEGIDQSKIKAEYKDGVLEVTVRGAAKSPPPAKAKAVAIKVQAGK